MKNPASHLRLLISLSFSLLLGIALLSSCKKNEDLLKEDFSLRFSQDTITFDTVFTTIGSSTQYLIVHNKEEEAVRINTIMLAGGSQSNFRINVDGLPGTSFCDIEIEAKDSLYIFVEVTVDPNNTNSPMVITDSIVFDKNGTTQDVDLVACGRDAHFILPDHFNITGLPYSIVAGEGVDTTWTNDKPIVIYGYAAIDSTGSLTIEEGTEVYFHANSGLWAYKYGRLIVNGTKDNPVTFQDDRPEAYYDDKPGQWDRIWLNEHPQDHIIKHAIIRNGFIGLQVENLDGVNLGNKVVIENTLIENSSGVGILGRNYNIDINNCVVTNAQQYALTLQGGTCNVKHSTFANYWSYSIRNTPCVFVSNYYVNPAYVVFPYNLDVSFENSIIYGSIDDELQIETDANLGGTVAYTFDHTLIKTKLTTSDTQHWTNIFKNTDPKFEDYDANDLHLTDGSPAIEAGKAGVLNFDIEGNPRDASLPDLGAYEYQP